MKTIAIALFLACVVGASLAQDCSAKIKAFHDCVSKGHQQDKDEMKTKLADFKTKADACYTANGCTPPAKGDGKGKDGASSSGSASGKQQGGNSECGKAMKTVLKKNFEDCLQKAGVTAPENDHGDDHQEKHFGGHHEGANHKDDNKALDGCAKKQEVRDCKRALFTKNRPSDAEMKAKFDAGCKARDTCLAALGADCQAQIEKFKKAACECRQQQFQQLAQVRAGVKECQNVAQKTPQRAQGKGAKTPKTCGAEKKDYCKLGFDALKADMTAKSGSHQ